MLNYLFNNIADYFQLLLQLLGMLYKIRHRAFGNVLATESESDRTKRQSITHCPSGHTAIDSQSLIQRPDDQDAQPGDIR